MVGAREPLEDDELRTLLSAADDHAERHREPRATRDRLFIYLLAYGGMRASTLAHMTKDWIDFQSHQIQVPAYQPCRAGRDGGPCSECVKRLELLRADPAAVNPESPPREGPCSYADPRDVWDNQPNSLYGRARRFERYADRPGLGVQRLRELRDGFSGMWFPKSGAGHRTLPVKDSETWNLIREYFQLRDGVMVSRQTVSNVVTEVARESGLTRKVEPHELRHTYGTRLAALDFSAYEIKDAMGHATTAQAEDYIKIAGKRLDDAFSEKWESV